MAKERIKGFDRKGGPGEDICDRERRLGKQQVGQDDSFPIPTGGTFHAKCQMDVTKDGSFPFAAPSLASLASLAHPPCLLPASTLGTN